jgi:hypothetical protein
MQPSYPPLFSICVLWFRPAPGDADLHERGRQIKQELREKRLQNAQSIIPPSVLSFSVKLDSYSCSGHISCCGTGLTLAMQDLASGPCRSNRSSGTTG